VITIEQQRLIESNLQQPGLIKGQGRAPIDSAPKDLSNWTTGLVTIGVFCPLLVSLHRNELKQEQCADTFQRFHGFLDRL